jgi:hypothetical protein
MRPETEVRVLYLQKRLYKPLGFLVLLNLIVALAYRPTPTFFSQDDFWFLDRVQRVDSLSDFVTLVGASDYFYRPVPRTLLLKLEHLLFDLQPFAYHAFSWLVHVANCGILFGLWRMLFNSNRLSFVAALYYGLHYAHFVPVTWVSGMQELSVIFWSLLSVLTYAYSQKSGKRRYLALSLFAFGLGVFSKENGLAVLIFIPVLDFVFRFQRWSVMLYNKIGYFLIAIGYFVIRMSKTVGIPSSGPYAWHVDAELAWHNILWYVSEGLYLRAWIIDLPIVPSLVVAGLGAGLFYIYRISRRHRQPIIIGSLWFGAALAPVLFLNRNYSYYLCVPLLGFSMLFGVIVDFIWSRIQRTRLLVVPWGYRLSRLAAGMILVGWVIVNLFGLQYVRDRDPLGLRVKARTSRQTIERVLAIYPQLPDQSTLYIQGASERDFWAMGKGSLFSLYYYPRTIEVVFDIDTSPSVESLEREKLYVYDFYKFQ